MADLTKRDRDLMRPFATMMLELYRQVEVMPDAEVAELWSALPRFGTTNCGWFEYDAAQLVREAIMFSQRVNRPAKPSPSDAPPA